MTLPKSRMMTLFKSVKGHSYIETYLLLAGSSAGSVTTNVATAAQTALGDFKNSFDSTKAAIIITGTLELGQTKISQTGSDIEITTCFEEGCESADFMKNDVSVE